MFDGVYIHSGDSVFGGKGCYTGFILYGKVGVYTTVPFVACSKEFIQEKGRKAHLPSILLEEEHWNVISDPLLKK